ncbi:MAG: carbohydrate kinase family protein [Eggerthella lenta]
MGEGKAVLAVGAIMVDMLCQVPRLPRSGEGIVVEESRAVVGGCAFNAANVLRQLGAPYELFAPVGCGIFAGFVERELRERGLEAPRFDDRDSGGCMCFVEPAASARWSRCRASSAISCAHGSTVSRPRASVAGSRAATRWKGRAATPSSRSSRIIPL